MIKLIVTDIDGTLLTPERTIAPQTKDAIRRAVKLGVPVLLCTGRIVPGARIYHHELDLDTPIVGCNGGIIQQPHTGTIIHMQKLANGTAKAVFDILKKYDLYHHFYSEDTIYGERNEHMLGAYVDLAQNGNPQWGIKAQVVASNSQLLDQGIDCLKVGFYADGTPASQSAAREIESLEGITLVQSREDLYDVVAQGVSKGQALEALATHYGISTKEIMAVGDQHNDLSMIQVAGMGVAMGNAVQPLLDQANFITETNVDHGLAKAIERFVLEVQES